MNTLFKSEAGKRAVLTLYEQKLAALAIDYTEVTINTSFGETHVLITGPEDGPPLLVLHGSNGCAPIALETYPALSSKYRVYAVDVMAQPNKSEGNRLRMDDLSYGEWLNEVIRQLELEAVTLAGFSFGGLIILKTLLADASRVKSAYLAAPAYIVNGNPLKLLWKMFLPMKLYMRSGRKRYLRRFLKAVFTDEDPFALQYLSEVFLHFEMDFTPVPVISEQEAGQINTPITLFAADQDLVFPGKQMIKRAKAIFPSLHRAELIQGSKHVQSRPQHQRVEQAILRDVG